MDCALLISCIETFPTCRIINGDIFLFEAFFFISLRIVNKQYQLYCWSHSSFPCSEPWVRWRNRSQRKSVRNFGLCSCSVLVIMDRFLTSEPDTPFLCYGSLVHSSLHRPNHIVSVWKEIQLKFFVQFESSHPMPLLWFNDHLMNTSLSNNTAKKVGNPELNADIVKMEV